LIHTNYSFPDGPYIPLRSGELPECKEDDLFRHVRLNVVGAQLITDSVLHLLQPVQERNIPSLIVSMSSTLGSITLNSPERGYYSSGDQTPYRIGKAALNMWTRNISLQLPGVSCVALCPGWIRTANEKLADLDAEESAKQSINVIERLDLRHTGQFLDYRFVQLEY